MQHFSAERIGELLTYSELADAIGDVFVNGTVVAPQRWQLRSGNRTKDALLIMPAWRQGGLGGS